MVTLPLSAQRTSSTPGGQSRRPPVLAPRQSAAEKKQAARSRLLGNIRKAGTTAPVWRALYVTEEMSDGEDWMPIATTTFSYDATGLTTKSVCDEDGSLTRTTFKYDANGKEIENIVETAEEGEDYLFSSRRTRTFDPVVTDFVTANTNYIWDDVESGWTPAGNIFERTVSRNAQGNVTEIIVAVPYEGNMSPTEKTTITYDEATGQAVTWSFQQYDPYAQDWGSPYTYADIEWQNTNGQLVLSSEQFLRGDNRLKKATIHDGEEEVGTLEVTYTEGKEDFVASLTYSDGSGKEVHNYTTLDGNESYREEFITYGEDDEMLGKEYTIETYDEQGNSTLYEEYLEEEGMEPELMYGMKVDYAYDEENRLLSATTHEWWGEYDEDSGEAIGGSYEPFSRFVYDGYIDATTGIATPAAAPAAPAAIYTLDGRRVNAASAKGVYIVNGKKVMR